MNRRANISCRGKRQYQTFKDAERGAHGLNRARDGAHTQPYHCRHCGSFHVGQSLGNVNPERKIPMNAPQDVFGRQKAQIDELNGIVVHQAAQARIEAGRYADAIAKLQAAQAVIAKSGDRIKELEAEVAALKNVPAAPRADVASAT